MRQSLLAAAVAALLGASTVVAQKCSLTQKCPKEAPCCGLYGDCGVGAFCLGGCDPRMSNSLDSCVAAPTCKDKKVTFPNLDKVADIGTYLGDSSKSDWVVSGEPLINDGTLLLTMPARSVGTVLSSTTYMWYGTVKAKFRSSRGAGVVSSFILFSDVKDEIDYEWVGTELTTAQTNYYFQGIPSYVNSQNITLSDTYANWHTYEIRWTPDEITWVVDGQVGRTKKRSETWNATAQQWDFPQTPSRVQFSIWPGGADSNAKGTIDWAGGPIDWVNHPDIKQYGYYSAEVQSVEMTCFNSPTAPGTNKGKSYYYNSWLGTNNTVVDGDRNNVLKSLLGTGLDMDKESSTGTTTGTAAPVASVPGGSVQGPGQGAPVDGAGTPVSVSPECQATTFMQSCGAGGSNGQNSGGRVAPPVGGERLLGASAFAVVIAFAGMLIL